MPNIDERLPARRVLELVTTEAGSDLIVFDEKTSALHTLNGVTATVWNALDGTTTVQTVSLNTGYSAEVVQQSVVLLADAGLLETPLESGIRGNQNRRSLLKKAGVGLVAVPVLISVTAPMASASASQPTILECLSGIGFGNQCYLFGNPTGLTCKSAGPAPATEPWWWQYTGIPWAGGTNWPASACLP